MPVNLLEQLRTGGANSWAVGGFNVHNLKSDRALTLPGRTWGRR